MRTYTHEPEKPEKRAISIESIRGDDGRWSYRVECGSQSETAPSWKEARRIVLFLMGHTSWA